MTKGTLYGLGIGPGDSDLITVKALKIIKSVDILVYPAPLDGDSLARKIIDPHLDKKYTEIAIKMPLENSQFPSDEVYGEATTKISKLLDSGSDIAAICEGDPFLYGSFIYLFERLIKTEKVVVVPGVSSPMACAAILGKPLVTKNDCLVIIPGTLPEEEIIKKMEVAEGVVVVKIGRHIKKVLSALKKSDLMDNAQYIERAGLKEERIVPLSEISTPVPYFSIIMAHRRGDAWK